MTKASTNASKPSIAAQINTSVHVKTDVKSASPVRLSTHGSVQRIDARNRTNVHPATRCIVTWIGGPAPAPNNPGAAFLRITTSSNGASSDSHDSAENAISQIKT